MNIKKISYAALFLFALFSIFSCDNEPLDPLLVSQLNNNSGGNGGSGGTGGNSGVAVGTFKVDYDGQTFVANVTQAIVNSDYIAITGLKTSTGEFFQLTIPNGTVGTYYTTTNATNAFAYSPGNGQQGYLAADDEVGEFANFPNYVDTAEVTIAAINNTTNTINGTFKFTGVRFADNTGNTINTKVFTNGSFNLTFTSNNPSPNNNAFFAKLNGQDFIPTNIDGFKNSGVISLIGRRGNVENINLTVPDNVVPGTYSLSFGGTYMGTYILNATGEGVFAAEPGTITVTSHNTSTKNIVGTFSFTATSFFTPTSFAVTQGTFNINYQ